MAVSPCVRASLGSVVSDVRTLRCLAVPAAATATVASIVDNYFSAGLIICFCRGIDGTEK